MTMLQLRGPIGSCVLPWWLFIAVDTLCQHPMGTGHMTVLQLCGLMEFRVLQWCHPMLVSTRRTSCGTWIITLYGTRKWIQAHTGNLAGNLFLQDFPQDFLARFPARFSRKISHKIFPQQFPTRFSHNNFPQDFPTTISHNNFPQDFPTTISRKIFSQQFPTTISCKIFPSWILIGWLPITLFQMLNFHQSLPFLNWLFPLLHFPQDFSARISRKIFPQEFPARISHKIFPQEFPTRFSRNNFPQQFPTTISRKIFLQDFPTRISCKIFPQEFPKLHPDWLAPHHPFQMLNFHQSLPC